MANNRHVAMGAITSIASNLTRVGVQLAMLPLMARLLGPAEIGLYTLAMPIMSFVLLLTEAGLGDSLAREKDPDSDAWSSAFWGLLVSATIMSSGIYVASFFIAEAAGQPRLPQIMLPLVMTVIATALNVVPIAKLTRAGRLSVVPLVDMTGQITGAALGIWMAMNQYGVWALVAQFVSVAFVRMTVLNIVYRFRPRFVFSPKSLAPHWGVGGTLLLTRLTDMFARIGENTLLSRTLGAASLGAYGYANQIARFTSDTVSNPAWASFYYMVINNKGGLPADLYVRVSRMLALILLLGAALITPCVPFLIPLLFGPKWDAAIYPMMILMVTYPFSALSGLQGAVTFNNGNSVVTLVLAVPMALARIAAIFFGAPWGLVGIATLIGLSYLIQYAVIILFVSPIVGNRRRDLTLALLGPVISALIVGSGLHFLLGRHPTVFWLAACIGIGIVTYFIALIVFDHKRIRSDIDMVMSLARRKG